MNITIEKIVYPEKSLARINGKVIFTDQGLPGETVEIAVLNETKGYVRAKTTGIIIPSPHRQQIRCSHYQACSPYQYIDYPQQISIKNQQFQEILSRQLKADYPPPVFRQSPQIWGYRNKIKVNIIRPDSLPQPAYNLPGTNGQFVIIDKCFLSPQDTNSFIDSFIKLLGQKDFPEITKLLIKQNKKNELLVCLYHGDFLEIELFSPAVKHLAEKFKLAGIVLINEKTGTRTVIWGDDFLTETISGKQFFIGSNAFFQINTDALELLVKDLEDSLTLDKNTILADLYCGVGTFGVLLAERVKQVIGIEIEEENFLFMEKNIRLNNLNNFDLRLCDCNDALISLLKKNVDIVIIDPPRKGAGLQVCKKLSESPVKTIVYISCDPATLSRDLQILSSSYSIQNIYAYDFFPHTPHIESMAVLHKKIPSRFRTK